MRQRLQPGAGGGSCASIQSSRRRHRHSISLHGGVGGPRWRRRALLRRRRRRHCAALRRRERFASRNDEASFSPVFGASLLVHRRALRHWSKALMVPVSAVTRERPAGINANDHASNIQQKWPRSSESMRIVQRKLWPMLRKLTDCTDVLCDRMRLVRRFDSKRSEGQATLNRICELTRSSFQRELGRERNGERWNDRGRERDGGRKKD